MLADAKSVPTRNCGDPETQAEELGILLRLACRIADDAGMVKVAVCLKLALHLVHDKEANEPPTGKLHR